MEQLGVHLFLALRIVASPCDLARHAPLVASTNAWAVAWAVALPRRGGKLDAVAQSLPGHNNMTLMLHQNSQHLLCASRPDTCLRQSNYQLGNGFRYACLPRRFSSSPLANKVFSLVKTLNPPMRHYLKDHSCPLDMANIYLGTYLARLFKTGPTLAQLLHSGKSVSRTDHLS